MRVLVLKNTHGQVDRINQLAGVYNADMCIHCGDVGFFDHISIKNMPAAELTKMIRHASLSPEEKEEVSSLPQPEQAEFVLQNAIAGNFEDYLTDRKTFFISRFMQYGETSKMSA